MAESSPQPRKLGLDRLSAGAALTLFEFIRQNVSWLERPFGEELAGLAEGGPDDAHNKIATFARSEIVEDKWLACRAVPYLALEAPEQGFSLWCQLMRDSEFSVWEAATDALSRTLGVLDLDPEGVIQVVEAHYEAGRIHNQPASPHD